jgi:hypothetical protein
VRCPVNGCHGIILWISDDESAQRFDKRRWRIIEDITLKTHFDLRGEQPADDLGGLVEDEDPDDLQPERDETDQLQQWELIGVDADDD